MESQAPGSWPQIVGALFQGITRVITLYCSSTRSSARERVTSRKKLFSATDRQRNACNLFKRLILIRLSGHVVLYRLFEKRKDRWKA
jgi:hypothetical protein